MSNSRSDSLIIGGGAAGYFAAALLLEINPTHKITILEQSAKVLQKVKVSGGGRCNVTNAVFDRASFPQYYPRGWKLMRKIFSAFGHLETIRWFEEKGVALYAQPDNRMFPVSDSSQAIIDCLRDAFEGKGGRLVTNAKVVHIEAEGDAWHCQCADRSVYTGSHLIVATGSSPFIYRLLEQSGIKIVPPVPSLFTFNISDPRISGLEGLSKPDAMVKITGTKFSSDGPLLITHWGLSGPAILKLSAWAARDLHAMEYEFTVSVNWTGMPIETARQHFNAFKDSTAQRLVRNASPFDIPRRLWLRLLEAAEIDEEKRWAELSKKSGNVLFEQMTNALFRVSGKSTFKDEFVTCGGVALSEIQPATMEHRNFPGLYFAGEVLDIDAITGGYNFQAAWTTAAVAAKAIARQ